MDRALRGGHSDRVPFTMYENKIHQSASERMMRNRGLCIVNRRAPVFRTHRPNVKVTEQTWWEEGKQYTRTIYETPVGEVHTLGLLDTFTTWRLEKMFKTPNDFRVLEFLIRDERYESCYEVFELQQKRFGDDVVLRAGIGQQPLQALISGTMIGVEDFCIQWMDNRDEIIKLYKAIVDNRRKTYQIVAASPALHANYGGNVIAEVIGPETFEKYYVLHYNEAAEVFHKYGKLLGAHLDGNMKLLADAIARTDLDYIEAFTPAPDTDMTLAEARAAWPDKVLWLNFPSSLHLKSDEDIVDITVSLLDEAGSVDGLLMGITENVPPDRWQNSCRAIMDGLEKHAKLRSKLYA